MMKMEKKNKVYKSKKRLTTKVDRTIKDSSLTDSEKDVLHLVTDESMTAKQISIRRGCSRQAVHKILKKLRQKGAYNKAFEKVDTTEALVNHNQNIRLHGQELNIRILWQNEKYQRILKKSNLIFIDGNTIKLYPKSVEIYIGHDFYGDNAQIAEKRSLEYLQRLIIRLEHDLNAILIKQRSANIRVVNQHYARTGSEVSESAIERGERIRIYAKEDGKLCFVTDDSFGFKEDEAVHPTTAKRDRNAIDKQINDWRLNNPPTNSELARVAMETSKNQLIFAENMKSHISAIQKLGSEVKGLSKAIKEFKDMK
jgi:DNA-binding CsgD family transcriptional regulator